MLNEWIKIPNQLLNIYRREKIKFSEQVTTVTYIYNISELLEWSRWLLKSGASLKFEHHIQLDW